jgi:hypothetical protein
VNFLKFGIEFKVCIELVLDKIMKNIIIKVSKYIKTPPYTINYYEGSADINLSITFM